MRKDFFTQLKKNMHNRESFTKTLTCSLYLFHFIFKVNNRCIQMMDLQGICKKRFLFIIPNLYTLKAHYFFSCPPQKGFQNNCYRTSSGLQNQLQRKIWPIIYFFIKKSKGKCLLKQPRGKKNVIWSYKDIYYVFILLPSSCPIANFSAINAKI